MVIVAGHVTVEARQRASYLAECAAVVEQARATAGCLDFAVSADLIHPMLSASVTEYAVADLRSLLEV
jgi:quinol monooxygenase YgiN